MGGKTISQLDAATSLNLTDVFEISQSGSSKKTTISEFSASLKTATELLSAQVTTTSTVITLANTPGIYNVVIPAAYMTADCATGVSALINITTGTGQTVIIPLYPKGSGIIASMYVGTVNIDSAGNCGFIETIPTVCAEMQLTANATSNTVIAIPFNYTAKDTHGGVTLGAGAKYTCRVSGRYRITAMLAPVATAYIHIYKGGVAQKLLGYAVTGSFFAPGSLEIDLLVNEYIDFRTATSVTVSGIASGADNYAWVQITRIGN